MQNEQQHSYSEVFKAAVCILMVTICMVWYKGMEGINEGVMVKLYQALLQDDVTNLCFQ